MGVGEDSALLLIKTRQLEGVDNSCDFRDCDAAQLDLFCDCTEGLGAGLQIVVHPGLGERALQSVPASIRWSYWATIGGE